jgi:mRNA interferase RelE/StbE
MPEHRSPWTVVVHRDAKKELRRLPQHVQGSVLASIHALASEPFPQGSSKLSGYAGLYRIRIGDWRIVYSVDGETRAVTILRVASRGEAYRGI